MVMSMSFKDKLPSIQQKLKDEKMNGWLIYDFRRNNDIGCDFLEIPHDQLLTRRFFYWIPKYGEPVKVVSLVEPNSLDHLPGKKLTYLSWQNLEQYVKSLLTPQTSIVMEYSPKNAVPAVSKVDAGTMDLIRSFGVDVLSSAEIMQHYTSVWDESQLKLHLEAAKVLDDTAQKTWQMIHDVIKANHKLTEYDVQQFMIEYMHMNHCVLEGHPICAINENSADPHYTPTAKKSKSIVPGDFILIDLWCKKKERHAVFADITRVACLGKPTEKQQMVFQIVRKAQQQATEFVQKRILEDKPLMGWEIDQAARQVIVDADFGQYFIHRTGHNIDIKDHGNGTHIDSLETLDLRPIIPNTCFSIEPGIYITGEFGVRLEYDIFIKADKSILVTGGIQDTIPDLLNSQQR